MSSWSVIHQLLLSVGAPVVVAALVTALIQRTRADLQLIKINETEHVADWLARAKTDQDPEAIEAMKHWQPRHIVLLTNHGNGAAYNIKLSGSDCRPRVYVRSTAGAQLPMWSKQYPVLEPGEMWSLVVMTSTDQTRKQPVLEVSWRGRFRRKKKSFDLANAPTMETGWPGKTKMDTDAS
jgi:hypothetical protein